MKTPQVVLDALNQVLTLQLTAINQYFLSAKMHKHRGFERLEKALYKQSIQAMRHAEAVIERVLYLEGLPNLQRLGKISVAESSGAQLGFDQQLQTELCAALEGLSAEAAFALRDIISASSPLDFEFLNPASFTVYFNGAVDGKAQADQLAQAL